MGYIYTDLAEVFKRGKATDQSKNRNKKDGNGLDNTSQIKRMVKAAHEKEDVKAQHGPVKIIMKDGKRVEGL